MEQTLTKQDYTTRSAKFHPRPIQYTFTIQLYKGESYQGLAEIEFYLKQTSDIFIDCDVKKIERLRINDEEINGLVDDGELSLPEKYLRKGRNVVLIQYRNQCSSGQQGLIFKMEEANQPVYMTQFEPYYAHTVFPMFDQPDLKAQMRLIVICSNKLKVLSNEKEVYTSTKIVKGEIKQHVPTTFNQQIYEFISGYQNGRVWIFPCTEILPTYLFCFAVGDFKQIPCPYQTKVPMSLYSTSQHFTLLQKRAELIFKVTIEGMAFFEEYFQTKFAFSKYDQLFTMGCPTAMENAGISIFRASYLQGEEDCHDDNVRLCRIVLHELCHHWFGNVATMEFWDDIWLNEGITTCMEDYALKSIMPKLDIFKEDIDVNILYKKNYALKRQKNTTQKDKNNHPLRLKHICCEHMFDSITYNKGAAITQQFQHLVGEKAFSDFCHQILTQFWFKNWSTEDFIRIGGKHCKEEIDLRRWVEMFVDTPGVTVLVSQISDEDGGLVVQQVKGSVRYFKTEIAVFKENCSHTIITHTIDQSKHIIPIPNIKDYKAVILNPYNTNYLTQILSPESSLFFKRNFHMIQSDHIRAVIYYSIPRAQKFQTEEFWFVENILKAKLSQSITSRYLGHIYEALLVQKVDESKIDILGAVIEMVKGMIVGETDGVKRKCLGTYNGSFQLMLEEASAFWEGKQKQQK